MKIGIDGNEANLENKVGVHQMAFEILWGLYKLEDKNKEGKKYIIYLKNQPNDDMPPERDFWKYKIIPGERLWILLKLIPELYKSKEVEVIFTPSHYVPPISPVPRVCMITDLGYLKFSGQFRKYDYWQLKIWTAISIIVSKYIIAISKSTKKDIVRHYPFASNKIKVVYLGPDDKNYTGKISKSFMKQTLNKYRISKKYVVFMSTLKPSKNIEGLIEAFKDVKDRQNYQLVIVGKKGWLYETIFEKINSLGLTNDVLFTDYVNDQERAALLAGAKVLVLPSFWEGFGIDVLNAFICRIPVIVSRVASLPEVAGKAGIYIDPNNIGSITKAINKVIKMSQSEYNKQTELGLKQVEKFSWAKASQETLKIIEKT